jgi:RecB family endonuclease NucS
VPVIITTIWFAPAKEQVHGSHGAVREFGDPFCVEHPPGAREFAYEKDLQNFLSKNLSLIRPGLHLYEEEGITGIEFPVGNRYIDILALDKDNNYVVIELKVSKGYDRVVGQLLRYMAWIKKNQADASQHVRGVIVARQISDDLLLACSELDNVELYEYQLSVSLQKISM